MKTVMQQWKDDYYVQIYELARQGLKNKRIAKILGVEYRTFKIWLTKKPSLKDALVKARGKTTNTQTFIDYVYDRLNPRLQALWDEINRLDDTETNQVEMIEALLSHAGERARQHLFVHCLVASNFNVAEACRKVNVRRKTFDRWVLEDPDFGELMDEINWHKKNFCESMLMSLVSQGETSAVIFVNKTLNRDRGYNPQVDVNITGQIVHSAIDIDTLKLPIEVRKQLLQAMEAKRLGLNMIDPEKQPEALPAHDGMEQVIPAGDTDED